MNLFILGILLALAASAQTVVNGGRTYLGPQDASGATTTKPVKSGTAPPGTCSVPEMYFETDATAGQNIWLCTATNTWTQMTGSADPNTVTAAGTLTSNAPVIGAGSKAAAVGTRSGNTTEFATISGTKTASKQATFDASGNVVASAYDVGAGGADTSLQTSVASSTATIAAGVAGCRTTTTYTNNLALSAATIVETSSGTGTIRIGFECSTGSPVLVARVESALTLGQFACTGITCTTAEDFQPGDFKLATLGISSGTFQTPTNFIPRGVISRPTAGTGISESGNTWSINGAVVGLLAGTNTWTAKQTMTPSATVAGLAMACAALPSSPVNGDIVCDSGDSNKVKLRSNGAWVDPSTGGGGTPAGSGTEVQYRNAGSFGAMSGSSWDDTNRALTFTKSGGSNFLRMTSTAAPSNGQYSYTMHCVDTSNCLASYGSYSQLQSANTRFRSGLSHVAGGDVTNILQYDAGSATMHFMGGLGTIVSGLDVAPYYSLTSSGFTRFANADTAGRGLVSIQGAPSELTGQTGNVAAQTLLASSHTAGMYRVCGFVAITATGTGSTAAWTLAWRSPASGSDLTHNLLWSSGAAETATFSVASTDEVNVCKVIRSTGTSAISLDPGDMNTATYTTAWTVERLR